MAGIRKQLYSYTYEKANELLEQSLNLYKYVCICACKWVSNNEKKIYI